MLLRPPAHVNGRMVFQHCAIVWLKGHPIGRHRLVDDAGVGSNNDDALETVMQSMLQRKGQRRVGLSTPRRDSEAEEPGLRGGRPHAIGENRASCRIDDGVGGACRERLEIELEARREQLKRGKASTMRRAFGVEVRLSVEEVSVDQRIVDHPREHLKGSALPLLPFHGVQSGRSSKAIRKDEFGARPDTIGYYALR